MTQSLSPSSLVKPAWQSEQASIKALSSTKASHIPSLRLDSRCAACS